MSAEADQPKRGYFSELPGRPGDWISPRRKRFWVIVLLVAYTLAGFFLVPYVARGQIETQLGEMLERPVRVAEVRFNPFVLSTEIRGFAITEPDGAPLFDFDRLFVNLQLTGVFRWAWTFREITLQTPHASVIRDSSGEINLEAALAPLLESDPEPDADDGDDSLVRLVIAEFNLVQGGADFTDNVPATPFETAIGPVDVTVRNISTLPDDAGHQRVEIQTERGTRIAWDGSLTLQPVHSSGRLQGRGRYVPLLARYFQDDMNLDLPEGIAEFSLDYDIAVSDAGELAARIDNMNLIVRDVRLLQLDREILGLREIRSTGVSVRYPEQVVNIQRYAINEPKLFLWRDPDGTLNLERLTPDTPPPTPPAEKRPDVASPQADVDAEAAAGESAPATPAEPAAMAVASQPAVNEDPLPGWDLTVERVEINDLALTFEDRALRAPGQITIDDLDLSLEGVSNAADATFPMELALSLESGGQLTMAGDIGMLPLLALDAQLEVADLKLAVLQPYIDDYADVAVDDGAFNLATALSTTPEETFAATGTLSFDDLAVKDRQQDAGLIGWKRIDIDHFELSTSGNSLVISEIGIDEPYVRLLIAEDQTTNFEDVLLTEGGEEADDPGSGQETAPAEPDEGAGTPATFATTIGQVNINEGQADFTDLALPIPFDAKIAELNGTLTTFSSASSEPSEVRIEGKINDYGLARIQGRLTPLGPTDLTDIELLFRNVSLPDMTPYTIRFAGREIDDGRMELDLKYKVEDGALDGRNSIVISDLQLGKKVEYPDAYDLPLGLAVALLKGPDGTLDVDVPVEGNVDDPEFRIGGVIVKAIINLITNVVTAPFRLLGSLVGADSETFDKLEFEPGRAALTPPEREKLAQLAEALAQRPQLTLEIPEVVDPEADRAALQIIQTDAAIDEALHGQPAAEAEQDRGEHQAPLSERRRAAVESLFTSRFPDRSLAEIQAEFSTPENPDEPEGDATLDETAYVAELRNRLVGVTDVDEAALADLAARRAAAVAAEVGAGDAVAPGRITTVPGATAEVDDSGWIKMTLEVSADASGAAPAADADRKPDSDADQAPAPPAAEAPPAARG